MTTASFGQEAAALHSATQKPGDTLIDEPEADYVDDHV
jgi:hypothetical protein